MKVKIRNLEGNSHAKFPGASLVAQLVKNSPAMQETWIRSLGWEDTLEKGTATHSRVLVWRIPWIVQSMRLQKVTFSFSFSHAKFMCVCSVQFSRSVVSNSLRPHELQHTRPLQSQDSHFLISFSFVSNLPIFKIYFKAHVIQYL